MATTVPLPGARIWVTTSFIRSAARRARSLASWAWAAVMLAAADPSACSAARLAWSAVIAARAARAAAVLAAPVSVASSSPWRTTCPRWTRTLPTRPEAPKLRLAMPLLTTPVNERLSAARIDGTYSAAPTTDAAASRIPPRRRARPANIREPSRSAPRSPRRSGRTSSSEGRRPAGSSSRSGSYSSPAGQGSSSRAGGRRNPSLSARCQLSSSGQPRGPDSGPPRPGRPDSGWPDSGRPDSG